MGGGGDGFQSSYVGDVSRRSSTDDYEARVAQRQREERAARERGLAAIINPKGKTLVCRRMINRPNATPIVIINDGTRSRGADIEEVNKRIAMLVGQLEMHGYVPDPAISFCIIGDATAGDSFPLQVGQFEVGNGLDPVLAALFPEKKGGGTGQESYQLAAYYYAHKTELDSFTIDGRKGYLFFVGDEGFYPQVSAREVKKIIGDDLPADLDSKEVFRTLQEKFHVFFVYPLKGWEERRADIDEEIRTRVYQAGGQYDNVDIRASLIWHDRNDLDLHCITPGREEIYYGNKRSSCRGELDVDRNVNGETTKPVENIRWSKGKAKSGRYRFFVRNYAYHEESRGPIEFKVELEVNGEITHFEGEISGHSTGSGSDVVCFEFDYDPNQRQVKPAEKEDVYAGYKDETIKAQWASVIPEERILIIDDPRAIIDIIIGAIALTEETVDMDRLRADMLDRGQTEERIALTGNALGGIISSSTSVVSVGASNLPAKTGPAKKTKSIRLK